MMNSDTPLDYAVFQLSPRRSRCELFVSGNGKTEKLASGFLKPFIAHLKVAEDQAAQAGNSIKLEVERAKNSSSWFKKGTLERFVRFVSTPDVLESANTYDAEMAQLEGARRIYSQGARDPLSGTLGEDDTATEAAVDTTKKELIRAIDVQLITLKQDLATACSHACSSGFSVENVLDLLFFSEYFGANRLNEACNNFISLCQRCPELIDHHQQSQSLPPHLKNLDNGNVRSSSSSDMSIDEPVIEHIGAGIPPDGGGLQVDMPSISQPSLLNTTKLSGTSQQVKLNGQHLKGAVLENIPSSANFPAQQDGGNFRQLSVKDRINLFESKQKEQSASSRNISTEGVVKRVVSGKGEHRRLSSDVSEKSVLRRWSSASDMSIDLSSSNCKSCNDQTESGSTAGTPTSVNLQLQSRNKTEETDATGFTMTSQCWLDLKESTTGTSASSLSLSQSQYKGFQGDRDCTEDESIKSSTTKNRPVLEKGQGTCDLSTSASRMEYCGLGDQDAFWANAKGFSAGNSASSKDFAAYHIQSKAEDHLQIEDRATLPDISKASSAVTEQVRWKYREGLQSQTREAPYGADAVGLKDQTKVANQLQTFGRTVDPVGNTKGWSHSQVQFEDLSVLSSEGNLLASQSQGKTFPVDIEEAGGRNAAASSATSGSSLLVTNDGINHQGIHWHQSSAYERGADEIADTEINHMSAFPVRKTKEKMDIVEPPSAHLMEQNQVVRSSKGIQALNDELRTKANDLEKLFTEHKLRTVTEQTASSRRSRPLDVQEDRVPVVVEKRNAVTLFDQLPENPLRETSKYDVDFDANFLLKMVGNVEYGNNTNQKLSTQSSSDDFRGKLYYKYMQKRDAKLREEWGTKSALKEAKMKAMRDSLECSQAVMNSRYSGSADRQSTSYTSRRAEKLRFFSNCLRSKNQAIESVEEMKDPEEPCEQFGHGQNTSHNDPFDDNSSKDTNSVKLPSKKTLSSSTLQTIETSVPKLSVKSTKSVSVKHRSQTENPLAEMLPDFSDFRKENAKPSAANNRVNSREKTKILSRSKNIIAETKLVKEEKPHRSQSMRKSTAGPGEFKSLSPLNSGSTDFTPLDFSKGQMDANFMNKVQKSGEFRAILRKEKGTVPGLGANIYKPKASKVSEVNKNGEDSKDIFHREDSPGLVKDVMEVEKSSAEGNAEAADFPVDSDSENPRYIEEYEGNDDFGSKNDAKKSLFQEAFDTVPVSPEFSISSENVQESSGPQSWNPCLHLSYLYEVSDIDASVDSPVGSPASWNLYPLNQIMEADVSRMRKKWGTALMPMIVANTSQQSHMDATKGFKRILKFGRKSRGMDNLVTDWVSASTASEGDDDTEDGCDLAARPMDDLRKSRMGYSLPYDVFNGGEIFPEKVQSFCHFIPNRSVDIKLREDHQTGSSLRAPHSFFSLSSLRSKELKPR
ncbi:uncharacterized protein LOC135599150 isoform X1 [Musa acuminata AAA Group]|uniref:uncharacterized protein LOC135599150 isoform X1 n=1 Tax=Musa acuminata AAA Group TaxID=214697 RepID=UPI0031DF6863